jgi:hypothetical protein
MLCVSAAACAGHFRGDDSMDMAQLEKGKCVVLVVSKVHHWECAPSAILT